MDVAKLNVPVAVTTKNLDCINKGTRVMLSKATFDDGSIVVTLMPTVSVQKFASEQEFMDWIPENLCEA